MKQRTGLWMREDILNVIRMSNSVLPRFKNIWDNSSYAQYKKLQNEAKRMNMKISFFFKKKKALNLKMSLKSFGRL